MRLSHAAATAVVSGHPWVLREEPERVASGTPLELRDGKGRYVGFGLADTGPIAVRVLSRAPKVPIREWIAASVSRADAWRRRFLTPETNAHRLLNGAGDGMDGVIVDRYGDVAVLRLYAAAWEPYVAALVESIATLPWCRTVVRRFGVDRVDDQVGVRTLHGPEPVEPLVVCEHGVRFLVRPSVGQKTGLFLDQRENRRRIRGISPNLVVANLFAYNGGFSVAAALGGARRVFTVDIAPDAIADARENFRLNGLRVDEHVFVVADAFDWRADEPLGLLVLDPPSLARDQKARPAAVRAYERLHRAHGVQVAVDGVLATGSCTARVGADDWRRAVAAGLARCGEWSWLDASAEPPDHPVAVGHSEAAYLKFAWVLRRR